MTTTTKSMLDYFPPMGIYEVLFSFLDSAGTYMGNPGTRPWAQGFPLTHPLPGGPDLPGSVEFSAADLKYPPATGIPDLLEAIRDYYNHFYGSKITTENVAVFAGGRPGIFAAVSFLHRDVKILIEEAEYTPYFDLLRLLKREHNIVPSNEANQFRPGIADYERAIDSRRSFVIKSNPCNPTGVTWTDEELKSLVEFCARPDQGGIIDEAYEFFFAPRPVSSMQYIENIDDTNIFVIGAATKGLQVPGMRIGWVVASQENIEIFRNYSSIAMGGVARPSQLYVAKLLERERVTLARETVSQFYGDQRNRYRDGLASLGLELFTGDGGFYHWSKLPGGLTARELNERLFKHQAGILPGKLCDMKRRGDEGPFGSFIRFSFGPLEPESLDENLSILKSCL